MNVRVGICLGIIAVSLVLTACTYNPTVPVQLTTPAQGEKGAAAAVRGRQIFQAACTTCHGSKDVPGGYVGPYMANMATLAQQRRPENPAQFIRLSITDPNEYIEKGFQRDVMPNQFGQTLPATYGPTAIDDLVAYLETQK